MAGNVYGLFVGIDKYPDPKAELHGCVADVTSMRKLLEKRIQPRESFHALELLDQDATRANIMARFRQHLGQAGPGDIALFYYAGHGSEEIAPSEFQGLDTGDKFQTLVCWDSRLPEADHWDLADKELSGLIANVAGDDPGKAPHIAIVLDCCHSGSGTRDSDEVTPRQLEGRQSQRPVATFDLSGAGSVGGPTVGGRLALPHGRHVLMAACLPTEKAKELQINGEPRGVFSYYLQEALQQATNGTPSYRDLFKRVSALVSLRVTDQAPQLEATDQNVDQPFLGGKVAASRPYFTMSREKFDWAIDGGSIQGIPDPADGKTELALFDARPDVNLLDLTQAIGRAEVTQVRAGQSDVTATLDHDMPLDQPTYKAVVTSAPVRRLAVVFEGDQAALDPVQAALARLSPAGASLVHRVDDASQAEYRLRAAADRYRIYRAAVRVADDQSDQCTLAVASSPINEANAVLAAQQLEHIARWVRIAELRNVKSTIPDQDISLQIIPVITVDEKDQELAALEGPEVRLEYQLRGGAYQPQRFKIRLTNRGQRDYFCSLLDLTQRYRVFAGYFRGGGVKLPAGNPPLDVQVLRTSQLVSTFPARIPDELLARGVRTYRDTLKLIISTVASDGTLLEQGNLPQASDPATGQRDLPTNLGALQRLMRRRTAIYSTKIPVGTTSSDWRTMELLLTTVMPEQYGPSPCA